MTATLDSAAGLARSAHLVPPDELGLWTVAVDVGLEESRTEAAGDGPNLHLVGACGWTRADALMRGAGEAVERLALVPPPSEAGRARVPAGAPGRVLLGTPEVGRSDPRLDAVDLDCLPAVELLAGGDGQGVEMAGLPVPVMPVLLPAAAVDDPVRGPERRYVDPGPTGAAAGPDLAFATERGLLEVVERDAAQCAWALRPPLPVVHPLDLPDGARRGDGGAARQLERALDGLEVQIASVILPSGISGLSIALTMLVDSTGPRPVLASGAKSAWSTVEAVQGSAREALQVLTLLRGVVDRHPALPPGATVENDSDRARFCTTSAAVDAARAWLDRCRPAVAADLGTAADLGAAADLDLRAVAPDDVPGRVEHLVNALRAQGLRPLVCDLTPRLPAPVRSLGWNAVHALVLGAQPLRMDERPAWSWVRPRLEDRARAWGVPVPAVLGELPPQPLV
ncbi:YcaO-like family protein [Motilibacter deserti]|uniref:YcaO-like family protein n=1 Tax=Motilibacter deserti TaxID=2714956 RepID=A0ABX0GXE0_9ACTN|nr:YcaO-like family protein [Motilibacter deserti]NHC15589.1 YcaO-like family protein [Motilibacter deserti]